MSYRLNNLAEGNFLLIFTPEHSSSMSETLATVTAVTPVNEDGTERVYKLVGVKKGPYGLAWESRSVSTGQDLKFTPLSKADADTWLSVNGVPDKFSSTLDAANKAQSTAELNCQNLQAYFLSAAPAVLEGVS